MFQNFIVKQLNADAQEPSAADTAEVTATITAPVAAPVATAHDDFDWSIDKRNVAAYNKEEKVKYDKVYDETFVTITDGELVKGLVVGMTKTDVVVNIGFKSDVVYYERAERFAGESKYPLKKMLSFAIDGITSFSVKPLKMISSFGVIVSFLSIIGMIYALISYFTGNAVAGWTAIVSSIWLLGGIQLLCIGVLGGYIGKVYSEVKARPRYKIEEFKK